MGWYFIVLCPIAIVLSVYLFFKWKFSYWKHQGVPTFRPQIPYGNLRANDARHIKDIVDEVYSTYKQESPVAGMYFAFSPVAVITDLDVIQSILIKNFSQFHDRQTYYNEKDDPLSAHMFCASGEKWRSLRQKLSPTFTSGKMKYMFPTIVEISNEFVATLREEIKTSPEIEIREYLGRFTTDVIGRVAFGLDCNSLKDPSAEFRQYGRAVISSPRHGRFATLLIRQFPSFAKKLHVKVLQDEVTKFFMNAVRETIAYRETNNVRRNDFMDLLIELKNTEGGLTFEEIAAQAFVFFLAGFETSSTLLTYTLFELGQNQAIQEKARKEVETILEKYNGCLTYEAMMDMPYVDQIINESLRKYPPVPILVRGTDSDFKVPNSSIVLEKGVKVFIPAYSIQHDPDVFFDPEKFDPNRFDPGEEKKRHPVSFLSFGDGPRNCIGLRFGRMQSRIGLISLLRKFRIGPNSKTSVPLEFDKESTLIGPKGGMYLNFQEVK